VDDTVTAQLQSQVTSHTWDAPSARSIACRNLTDRVEKWNGEGGPEDGALGAGAVGVGSCARLRWLVDRTRSVS